MKDVDVAILTLLAETDIWLSPNNIAKNTGYVSGYIAPECKKLVEQDYLEVDPDAGDPFYRITDEGRQRLNDQE